MSRWSGMCRLIKETVTRDSYGVSSTVQTAQDVSCNVFSISDAAYYAASAAGFHPTAVIQLRKCAYNGERVVELDGAVCDVVRVNHSSPDYVTLTLEERVGNRG